ncbi:MAG TPA: hypothetical protein VKD91_16565 [Pyrinomonadaceae bacterium]|nr:hypothetical protein [Pyrinomonadaceae bacterium]
MAKSKPNMLVIFGDDIRLWMEFPPSQGADTLSMKQALEEAQRKMENPNASSN